MKLLRTNIACPFTQTCRESPDPYVINSRGNCYNSLGMWAGGCSVSQPPATYLASSDCGAAHCTA